MKSKKSFHVGVDGVCLLGTFVLLLCSDRHHPGQAMASTLPSIDAETSRLHQPKSETKTKSFNEEHPSNAHLPSNTFLDLKAGASQSKDEEEVPPLFYSPSTENHWGIPNVGELPHCFLHEAPHSNCGQGSSLTLLFMEQCMTFYFRMAHNIDGLCRRGPLTEVNSRAWSDETEEGHGRLLGSLTLQETISLGRASEESYAKPVTSAPTPTPTPTPTTRTPRTAPPTSAFLVDHFYLQERCAQKAYISILTALVLCFTENTVRLQFIEYYAADAQINAVEGPMLYLRKLHDFVNEVITCSGSEIKTYFPQLYKPFKREGFQAYNPNSPFQVSSEDSSVGMEAFMNSQAAGLDAFVVGQKFLCSDNTSFVSLPPSPYNSSSSNNDVEQSSAFYDRISSKPHYQHAILEQCSTEAKTVLGERFHGFKPISNVFQQCNAIVSMGNSTVGRRGFFSDMTIRGFYDAVAHDNSVSKRAQSIVEIATYTSDVRGEPLLEGFGMLYFCSFYACKATAAGHVDGNCFPSFEPEKAWNYPVNGEFDLARFWALKKQIQTCRERSFLSLAAMRRDVPSQTYLHALNRSYLCLSEKENVRFLRSFYNDLDAMDSPLSLVYLRHLAVEKCYEESQQECHSTQELYRMLQAALTSLLQTCHDNFVEYQEEQFELQKIRNYQTHNPAQD